MCTGREHGMLTVAVGIQHEPWMSVSDAVLSWCHDHNIDIACLCVHPIAGPLQHVEQCQEPLGGASKRATGRLLRSAAWDGALGAKPLQPAQLGPPLSW